MTIMSETTIKTLMKIYVASSWRNPFHNEVVDLLRNIGHEVYDYRNPEPGNHGFTWSEIDEEWKQWDMEMYKNALEHPVAEAGFNFDFAGMNWAEACVMVMPSGRSAHTEAGYMKGQGKKVFVYMPAMDEPELMYKVYDGILTNGVELINEFRISKN
jgi:hypothetical protein